MLIPLKAGADISKYQPKTSTPDTKFQYAGLSWTLKSATESYSIAGNQATQGNVYITIALNIANSTSNNYSAYYADIARLTAGSSTNAPTSDSNLPTIASQSNGSATLVFLVPQGNTSYTLMMLAKPSDSPPIQGVPVSFTIQ
ncbi:MAG TPA: hypothetical protein VGN15_02460 [Ktedonobacteraceae bacterium]|nr:hypothetical protein [Ktedonobacteraceae bacterium]